MKKQRKGKIIIRRLVALCMVLLLWNCVSVSDAAELNEGEANRDETYELKVMLAEELGEEPEKITHIEKQEQRLLDDERIYATVDKGIEKERIPVDVCLYKVTITPTFTERVSSFFTGNIIEEKQANILHAKAGSVKTSSGSTTNGIVLDGGIVWYDALGPSNTLYRAYAHRSAIYGDLAWFKYGVKGSITNVHDVYFNDKYGESDTTLSGTTGLRFYNDVRAKNASGNYVNLYIETSIMD